MNPRRGAILREIGLAPIWRLRGVSRDATAEGARANDMPLRPVAGESSTAAEARDDARVGHRGDECVAPPAFVPPAATAPQPAAVVRQSAAAEGGDPTRIAGLDWEALEADIRACRACRLCERRIQAVPGVGDREADWMFVGEGPGSEEDQRGEPFVGAAGRLLDAMLAAIGLARGQGVYIANAVKCRPPHNRTPQTDEIATCRPYLARQIALVKPRLIVALGRPAAYALLGTEIAIGASRGRVFDCEGTPVLVTYHPAYLLRNPADKAKAWEDLCFARRTMREGRA